MSRNNVVGTNTRPKSNLATGRDYTNDKKYNRLTIAERVARNRARRKLGLKKGDPRDASHTRNGLIAKHKSKNRGSKSDMPGDVAARGGGRRNRARKFYESIA
jgi:hypothetical protein